MIIALRLFATALAGWLFYVAAVSRECANVGMSRLPELSCLPAGEGLTTGLIASLAAAGVGVVLLAMSWIPALVSRRRERANLEASLLQNLDRLSTDGVPGEEDRAPDKELVSVEVAAVPTTEGGASDSGSGTGIENPAPSVETEAEQPLDLYSRRVSELREEFESGSDSPKKTFARWIGLLKELDREHEQGRMETEDLCRLNSELLEMMPLP
jgi:hypothetical protein